MCARRCTLRSLSLDACLFCFRAGSVAFALRNTYSLEKGSRVVLCYTPGLEFIPAFMGCLRAGVVAVPVYPPNPSSMAASLRLLSTVRSFFFVQLLVSLRDQ